MNSRLALLALLITTNASASTLERLELTLTQGASEMPERPTLYIQCQLRTAMDCETLRRAYFDRLKVIERMDNESALIRVKLSDEVTPNGTLVHAKWSAGTIKEAPLPDLLLPPQYDQAKIQSELITLITRPVVVVIQMESGTGLEELVIKSLEGTAPTPDAKSSPFYSEISLGGSAKKNGIGAINPDGTAGPTTSSSNASVSIALNRTTQRSRYSAQFTSDYSKNSQPGSDGTTISAENLSRTITLTGVYSIEKKARWNVALITYQSSNPGANIQSELKIVAGLEYNLVPFRVDQPYEFRVRSKVSRGNDRLVMANDRGNTEEDYYSMGAELYAFWLVLKDKASIYGGVYGSTNLSHRGYSSASAYLVFNYQITRGISFNSFAQYSFVKKNIAFPATPDFSNPLQTKYLSGYSGGSYTTSIGLTFKIGKGGTLLTRDRRFQ